MSGIGEGSVESSTSTIGLVLPYLKSRGTERQALQMARNLLGQQVPVLQFVLTSKGDFFEAFADSGVRVLKITEGEELKGPIGASRAAWNLSRLAREHGCGALVSCAVMSNVVTSYAARLAGVPAVAFVTGRVTSAKPKPTAFLQWAWWLRRFGPAAQVACVSETGAARLREIFPFAEPRIQGFPIGVNTREVQRLSTESVSDWPVPDSTQSLVFVGSLDADRKGLDILVDALSVLKQEDTRSVPHLVLVGSGKDRQLLEEQARRNDVDEFVHFLGERHNPYPYFARADIFVLPSRREGFPNVLLEAMTLGLPCIAADCDTGPREIITDGENGILVPPKEARPLAEAIRRMVADPALQRRIGEAGRQTVEQSYRAEERLTSLTDFLRGVAEPRRDG